jgi:hypothetical protein
MDGLLMIGIATSVLSPENHLLPKVFASLIPSIFYPLVVWICLENFNKRLKNQLGGKYEA